MRKRSDITKKSCKFKIKIANKVLISITLVEKAKNGIYAEIFEKIIKNKLSLMKCDQSVGYGINFLSRDE